MHFEQAVTMLTRSIEDMDEAMDLLAAADNPDGSSVAGVTGFVGTFKYPTITHHEQGASYLSKSVVGRNVSIM